VRTITPEFYFIQDEINDSRQFLILYISVSNNQCPDFGYLLSYTGIYHAEFMRYSDEI
jgi:hypothetical protein